MLYEVYSQALSLFTFFSSAFLGTFVLSRASREQVNRVFALFTLEIALWALADFGIRTAPTTEIAMFWSRVVGPVWILVGPTFLHLVLLLTRMESLFAKRYSYLVLYGPGIIFLCMFWLTWMFYPGASQVPFGPVVETLLPGAYMGASIILGIFYGVIGYQEFTGLERTQIGIVTGAIIEFGTACFLLYAVLPFLGIERYGLGSTLILPPVIAVLAVAIAKYQLFSLPPISRFFVPAPEAELRTKPKFALETGRGYLVKEEKASPGLVVFIDQIKHGAFGLWITSLSPRQGNRYGLRRTPIVYLSTDHIKGEMALPPNKLDRMITLVSNYLIHAHVKRTVIYIDCFGELVMVNGFSRAMDFLKKMAQLCSKNNSTLIVQVDSNKFKKEQLDAMENVITPLETGKLTGLRQHLFLRP